MIFVSPTIVIGIGAQKAGSSWLYDYLRSHPQIYLRSTKELHYFNRIGKHDIAKFREILIKDRAALLQKRQEIVASGASPAQARQLTVQAANKSELISRMGWPRNLFAKPHGAYVSYLKSGLWGRKVIGEITPANSSALHIE